MRQFQLNTAEAAVKIELDCLELLSEAALQSVNQLFEELGDALATKRLELIADLKRRKDEKAGVLARQVCEIEAERCLVAAAVVPSQQQRPEVKEVTRRICELNTKLELINSLADPRENHYIGGDTRLRGSSLMRKCVYNRPGEFYLWCAAKLLSGRVCAAGRCLPRARVDAAVGAARQNQDQPHIPRPLHRHH